MTMTRVSRGVLVTIAVLALVVGVGATIALLGCGSSGGSSALVGPTEDVVLFPGGGDDAKPTAPAQQKVDPNIVGINLGDSGYFHSLSVVEGYVDNHWFKTKAGVSYQVEVIAEGTGMDVDLYIARTVHPCVGTDWKHSSRYYPLMDGIVFRSAQDGIMYADVHGFSDGQTATPGSIPYRIHVRRCQFGTFNQ